MKETNNRIAKNTLMLYIRMILLMAISLYTSRVILEELGVVDYGIYNVVSGFIVLLAFINSGLSSSTSRYITYAIGQGDNEMLKRVFAICLESHVIISIVILIVGETIGLWVVSNVLDIPTSKENAAFWVYQCAIITTIVIIWCVPYNANIIAHESMSIYAYISILEAISKLAIAFCLCFVHENKLIIYAFLVVGVQFLIMLIYIAYNLRNYKESKPYLFFEKKMFKEIMSFAGWNLWGGLSVAMFTQGVNMLLNVFFGPIVNTARGLAVTVQNTVQQFSTNFQTAINPQIIKTYANQEYEQMYELVCRGSKFTFILLSCLIVPIISETPFILGLWLKDVPLNTISFVRIMLIISIIEGMSNAFMTAMVATGDVKKYQIILGAINLLIIPIGYIALKLVGAPITIFIIQLMIYVINFFVRIYLVAQKIKFPIYQYIKSTIVPCAKLGLIFSVVIFSLKYCISIPSFVIIILSFVSTVVASFFLGLSKSEKLFLINTVKVKIHK